MNVALGKNFMMQVFYLLSDYYMCNRLRSTLKGKSYDEVPEYYCQDWYHYPGFQITMSVRTQFKQTLWDLTRYQMSQTVASHLHPYYSHDWQRLKSKTDSDSSFCLHWHKLSVQTFPAAPLFSLYLKCLFFSVVGKHLCVVAGSLNPQLCSLSLLCVSFTPCHILLPSSASLMFTWFRVLREKTNKGMSSASFITSQPVISASAVVSLRCCHLICLSLS